MKIRTKDVVDKPKKWRKVSRKHRFSKNSTVNSIKTQYFEDAVHCSKSEFSGKFKVKDIFSVKRNIVFKSISMFFTSVGLVLRQFRKEKILNNRTLATLTLRFTIL